MNFQLVKPDDSRGLIELHDPSQPVFAGFATVWSTGAHHAPLLAAAPDLLKALQKFAEYEKAMDDSDDISGMLLYAEFANMAHAAIAKAEGAT